MTTITVFKRDGSTRVFSDEWPASRTRTPTVAYEGAFAILTDQYGAKVAIPAADIKEITIDAPPPGSW